MSSMTPKTIMFNMEVGEAPKDHPDSDDGMIYYRNGSFIHEMNISRMTILGNICDFIFINLLTSWHITL